MKLTAFIFLLIFTTVQVAPAVKCLCNATSISLFNPDEEKGADKISVNNIEEIKEKKTFFHTFTIGGSLQDAAHMGTHRGKQPRLPQPVLDMVTPPPNYA